MMDQFFDSLSKIGVTQSVSDFVDLSQIYSLPSVNLWSRKDEVLSHVSSSNSSRRSIISNCSDSISSMTSSESDGSIVSLDYDYSKKVVSLNIFNDFQELCVSASSGNVHKLTIYSDQMVNFGMYINYLSGLTRQLSIIYKYLCVQISFNVESILKCSLEVFRKLHNSVCILSSLDYASKRSEKINSDLLNELLMIFKETYSEIVLFNTHTCKLLSTKKPSNIVSMVLDLMPYLMDTLFCILLFLLQHLEQSDTKEELSSLFEKILGYCVIFCYSYLDHAEELLNKMSILALYRLTITFVPLDLIHAIKEKGQDDFTDLEKNYRTGLVEYLKEEYLRDEFKPSSILLFKFRSDSYFSGDSNHEVELVKRSLNVLESCLRTGVSRLQYPTTHIDNFGLFDTLLSSSVSNLLTSLNFWLLQKLDNSNVFVRRITLLIIRHSLCTINFIERERQFVLSYVYNCLSDEETLTESLSIINCLSKLYPLKDGAVRKISNLTLKGSRREVRLKVIDFLSSCCFTKKGVSMVLSVFRSLTKLSNSKLAYSGVQNEVTDSSEVAKIHEFMFGLHEWPAIVDALVSIANLNPDKIDKNQLNSEYFTPFIKRRKLSPMLLSSWIPLLWSYINNSDDEKAQLFKSLWFTEAMIRFPRMVKSVLESDSSFVKSHLSVYNKFVEFAADSSHEQIEFLKNHNHWKFLHDLHFPYSLDHLEKATIAFDFCYSIEDRGTREKRKRDMNGNYGNGCKCADCRMDLMIKENFKFPGPTNNHANSLTREDALFGHKDSHLDPINDVLDSTVCNKFTVHKEGLEPFKTLGEVTKMGSCKAAISHSPVGRISLAPRDVNATYYNVEDLDCFEYPASLGTDLHIDFLYKSAEYPSNLLVAYRPPLVVNPRPDTLKTSLCEFYGDDLIDTTLGRFDCTGDSGTFLDSLSFVKAHLRPDDEIGNLYHVTVSFRLSFHNPTVIPFKVKFYYMIDNLVGLLGCVWIHPKCKS